MSLWDLLPEDLQTIIIHHASTMLIQRVMRKKRPPGRYTQNFKVGDRVVCQWSYTPSMKKKYNRPYPIQRLNVGTIIEGNKIYTMDSFTDQSQKIIYQFGYDLMNTRNHSGEYMYISCISVIKKS